MLSSRPVPALAFLLLSSLVTAACSSSAAAGPGVSSSTSADSGKTVSLRNDVLPVFAANCNTSACHGSPTGIEVFLAGGAANATAIRDSLVGVASVELPSMPFVAAGDPSKSYIVYKLDGEQTSFGSQCSANVGCGGRMPFGKPPLDDTTRETIRTWIADGAQDN